MTDITSDNIALTTKEALKLVYAMEAAISELEGLVKDGDVDESVVNDLDLAVQLLDNRVYGEPNKDDFE